MDSPNQQHVVRIKEWCIPPDCGIKAEVSSAWLPFNIGQVADGSLLFGHVAWSPDSSTVGVFVVNGYGEDIRSAYDTRSKGKVPFGVVESVMRESIQRSYKLTHDDLTKYHEDPLEWAEKDDGAHAKFRGIWR
jgi:hypothetical protein